MIPLTIAVAVVAVALALWAKPPVALGILICSLMLYPEYLRVPVGPVKMSVPRFVAVALLFRLAYGASSRGFRWNFIDGLVCFEWVWMVTANILAGADSARMSELVGRVFDSVFMYFVARFCVVRAADYYKLVWPLLLCAVISGSLGFIESVTHRSPYEVLRGYSLIGVTGWDFMGGGGEGDSNARFGLRRAEGATSTCLYFGMAMLLIMGMLQSVSGFTRKKWLMRIGWIAAFLGVISSMSSGPQSALVTFMGCSIFYFVPKLIKPAIVGGVALAIFCEAASNRHFWYLIEYLNPLGGDYWYRCQLITVTISQWRDYWLIGVGSDFPQYWGQLIDGRIFVDLANEYVIVATTSGFLGLACRLGIQGLAIRETVRVYRNGDEKMRRLAFAQASTLIALVVGSVSIGSFGAVLILSSLLLGMMVGRPGDAQRLRQMTPVRTHKNQHRKAPALASTGAPQS